jgi:hypothetical protein
VICATRSAWKWLCLRIAKPTSSGRARVDGSLERKIDIDVTLDWHLCLRLRLPSRSVTLYDHIQKSSESLNGFSQSTNE